MNLEKGLRRILVVLSVAIGSVSLWQGALAVREARIYQAQMRAAAARWGPFEALYRAHWRWVEAGLTQELKFEDAIRAESYQACYRETRTYDELERCRDKAWKQNKTDLDIDRLWKKIWDREAAADPGLRPLGFNNFSRYQLYRDADRYAAETPGEVGWPVSELRSLRARFPSLLAGIRADIQAAGAAPTRAEILSAYQWFMRAARPEGGPPPWQFAWWGSQPAWWRWPLPAIALLGLVLSAVASTVPWAIFSVIRWVVHGFLDRSGVSAPRAGGAGPAPAGAPKQPGTTRSDGEAAPSAPPPGQGLDGAPPGPALVNDFEESMRRAVRRAAIFGWAFLIGVFGLALVLHRMDVRLMGMRVAPFVVLGSFAMAYVVSRLWRSSRREPGQDGVASTKGADLLPPLIPGDKDERQRYWVDALPPQRDARGANQLWGLVLTAIATASLAWRLGTLRPGDDLMWPILLAVGLGGAGLSLYFTGFAGGPLDVFSRSLRSEKTRFGEGTCEICGQPMKFLAVSVLDFPRVIDAGLGRKRSWLICRQCLGPFNQARRERGLSEVHIPTHAFGPDEE